MQTLRVRITEHEIGFGGDIEFTTADMASAMYVLEKQTDDVAAEVWQHDEKLCALTRSKDGFWQLIP